MGNRKQMYSQIIPTNFSSQMFFFLCLFYFGNYLNKLLYEQWNKWNLASLRFFFTSLSSLSMSSVSSSANHLWGQATRSQTELNMAALSFSCSRDSICVWLQYWQLPLNWVGPELCMGFGFCHSPFLCLTFLIYASFFLVVDKIKNCPENHRSGKVSSGAWLHQ